MATRTEKCKWCKARFQVQVDAQSFTCPKCRVTTQLPSKSNLHFTPSVNCVICATVPAFSNAILHNVTNKVQQTVANNVQRAQMFLRSRSLLPRAQGQKRAVVCGVSYMGHPKNLQGSLNNVSIMKHLLIERLGFPYASVILLTEDEKDPTRIPTKANIRAALHWLVQGCQEGDSMVFYYTGHASKVRDLDGDEMDGHDEALWPVDYETEGRILDDEINKTIVRPLPSGVTLHAIIDTIFSGTLLDLPYMCRMNREGYYFWEYHPKPNASNKGTEGGLAICISACDDHQTSGDTTVSKGSPAGVLTYSFNQILEKDENRTYGQLLIALRKKVQEARQKSSLAYHLPQEPQLSASDTFDIHSKQFTL